jgi:folate-binding protein YgfZ
VNAAAPAPLSPEDFAGWRRLRETVGVVDFSGRGVLHLSGPDGPDFLQGLVTNDVAALPDGRGCGAAILTPLGRVFALLAVFRAGPDALYLFLQARGAGPVADFLERYRFNEVVEIADLTAEVVWLSLQGPEAPAAAAEVFGDGAVPDAWGFRLASFAGRSARVARLDEAGVPGVHVLVHASAGGSLREALERAAAARGGGGASPRAWDVLRVEAGVPWQGVDVDEAVLPMEAGLHGILSETKGCYIGQETVARALVQGRTNWSLWRLRLPAGSGVQPGQELRVREKPRPVVRVRSVVASPAAGAPVALGYVHRDAARPGDVTLLDGDREIRARLEPLGPSDGSADAAAPGPSRADALAGAGEAAGGPRRGPGDGGAA